MRILRMMISMLFSLGICAIGFLLLFGILPILHPLVLICLMLVVVAGIGHLTPLRRRTIRIEREIGNLESKVDFMEGSLRRFR